MIRNYIQLEQFQLKIQKQCLQVQTLSINHSLFNTPTIRQIFIAVLFLSLTEKKALKS